jgi:hypothetical protein
MGAKVGMGGSSLTRNAPRIVGEWSSQKRRRKAGEERGAGESGADEARERGQAEEHLVQEVVAEGEYGGRSGLSGFLLPGRQCTRGHGGGGGGSARERMGCLFQR